MRTLPLTSLNRLGALAALASLAFAGTVAAQDAPPTELTASLTGMAEPAGGDADGSGMFSAEIDGDSNQLCYELRVSNVGSPTAAHIHRAPEGENGPPVVTLDAPAMGSAEGCVDLDADLATRIAASPASFYVNVHNDEFGAGAVRGQLEVDTEGVEGRR